MRRSRTGIRRVALLLTVLSTTVIAAPKPLNVLSTSGFTLYGTEDAVTLQRLATNLAAFDKTVRRAAGTASQGAAPTRIFIVSRNEWEQVFKPARTTGGFYNNTQLSSDIVVPATGRMMPVLYHEYTHHLMRDQSSIVWPPWFAEGLASLLEEIRFQGDRGKFEVSQRQIAELRYLPWMDTESVLKLEHTSPEYRDHRLTHSFYSQSWLLMHYAFVGNPQFLQQSVDYIVRINRGESADAAVAAAFKRTYQQLDAELRAYRDRSRLQNGVIPVEPDRRAIDAIVTQLGSEESLTAYVELALRLQIKPSKAQLLVDSVAGRQIDSPQLAAAIALLMQLDGKTTHADSLVSQIVGAAAEGDQRTQILVGDVFFARAEQIVSNAPGDKPEADALVTRARRHYRQALQLDRKDLEAVHSFAATCIWLGTQCTEALEAVDGAARQSPSNPLLLQDLAVIYEKLGDSRSARQYWTLLFQHAPDMQTKEKALAALANSR